MLCVRRNKVPNKSQRGASTVEFSVIAALLFVFLFGIIEYAMIFLQEHYVANAAREAVRIGVRANNYYCYKGTLLPTAGTGNTCNASNDRRDVVKNSVAEYLNVFYDANVARDGTSLLKKDLDGSLTTDKDRVLTVTVTVRNLFTSITPGLISLISQSGSPGSGGPQYIGFSASMELEDPKEFDPTKVNTPY